MKLASDEILSWGVGFATPPRQYFFFRLVFHRSFLLVFLFCGYFILPSLFIAQCSLCWPVYCVFQRWHGLCRAAGSRWSPPPTEFWPGSSVRGLSAFNLEVCTVLYVTLPPIQASLLCCTQSLRNYRICSILTLYSCYERAKRAKSFRRIAEISEYERPAVVTLFRCLCSSNHWTDSLAVIFVGYLHPFYQVLDHSRCM